ncbi:MAG: hypothetical protein DMF64_00355 [Acidobacteria bacterium]|nr:MAG: hypothetical protein DMF64_00355 [Acidobacteriota bacterium]
MKIYPSTRSLSPNEHGKSTRFSTTRKFKRDTRRWASLVRFCVIVAFAASIGILFYSASSASSLRRAARSHNPSSTSAAESAQPAKSIAKERAHKSDTAPQSSAREQLGIGAWAVPHFPALLVQAPPPGEAIATYASDCTTPKNDFTLGDTVCAKVTNAPVGAGGVPAQRLTWVAHDGAVAQAGNITSTTQTGTYLLPTSATQTLGGITIDNRGTWRVNTSSTSDGSLTNTALFTVHDPAGNFADVQVNQSVSIAASEVGTVGSNGAFGIVVTNLGPDTAQNVSFTEPVPNNTTFVSFTQTGGPTFTCTPLNVGDTGSVSCSITSLAKDAAASFSFVYQVASTGGGNISNTATVSSTTTDPDTGDNSADAGVTLPGGTPPSTCTVSCPTSVVQDSDPNQAGAIVTYTDPSGSDPSCGTVSCDHPSGSFFPIGQTTVTCGAETGDSCSFMVTINDARPIVITLNGADPLGVECHTSFVDPGVTATSPDPNATVTVNTTGTVDANTPGTYTLTYTATDGTHSATATRTVNVEDTTPPMITLAGANPMTIECHSTFTDPGAASATDSCAGDLPNSDIQVTGTVDPNVPGTYNLIYTITDPAGNPGTVVRDVHVVDTTPPSITLNGVDPMTVECHGSFSDPGATATDTCAGDLTSAVNVSGSVNPNVAGSYTLTYTVSDGSNTTTKTRTVNVVDTTPPTLTLNGADPITVECHTSFADPGAAASDTCAGDLTSAIQVSGSVNADAPGAYTLTYTVSDGSNTTTKTRTVNVVDTTPPTIALSGANPMTVECHTTFADPGATATDSCAGSFAATASGTVNANVPGTYTITYNASDAAGNAATPVTRTVNVVDTLAPTITLNGASPMTVECHTSFTDPGATAADQCAGNLTSAIVVTGSVNPNAVGTYTLSYTVNDGQGHSATATRTVNVVDTTPPTISCPANVVVSLPANSTATSMVVNYPAVTATDSCAGTATVVSTPASGSAFSVGTTTVNATATDASGNTSHCSFTVKVLYNFTGFLSPVANLPTINQVNAGRAIPMKFSLSGNKGLGIFPVGSPDSQLIACDSGAPLSDLQDTTTAGSSSLSYDSGSDQYNYVWKTDSAWAGTCRQFVLQLNDGSVYYAKFKFR